jgi:hypothetical protein
MNVLLHLAPEMIRRVFAAADLARLGATHSVMDRNDLPRLGEADETIRPGFTVDALAGFAPGSLYVDADASRRCRTG